MRLDILIYAHDGRGLGHVSRSLGIGMALRRLYPELKILFISGSTFTGELLGRAPLDWLKLPSYKTEVVGGKSRGVQGNSMFLDRELGELRGQALANVVALYKPRLVLVDHTPQGKHRELLPALKSAPEDCRWVMGVRGVVGAVPQAKKESTRSIFQNSYSDLLWYGDSAVLGNHHLRVLKEQYGLEPQECGYVARLGEYMYFNEIVTGNSQKLWAGVVSVPWLGEKTFPFLQCLAAALSGLGGAYGMWCLFVDDGLGVMREKVDSLFAGLTHCHLRRPGGDYGKELMRARCAVIYGGYNSLVDVLYAKIPSVVILRDMRDQEQQEHVVNLQKHLAGALKGVSEDDISSERLQALLVEQLDQTASFDHRVNTDGAKRVALYLHSKL